MVPCLIKAAALWTLFRTSTAWAIAHPAEPDFHHLRRITRPPIRPHRGCSAPHPIPLCVTTRAGPKRDRDVPARVLSPVAPQADQLTQPLGNAPISRVLNVSLDASTVAVGCVTFTDQVRITPQLGRRAGGRSCGPLSDRASPASHAKSLTRAINGRAWLSRQVA
jgi:hypothetical protein